MDFFHSLTFGITALVVVGASWCLIGLVMGNVAKHGLTATPVLRIGSIISCLASAVIYFLTGAYRSDVPLSVIGWTCLAFFVSGFANNCMLSVMSKAMQKGPNGVIWCIIQSAVIFPFLVGIFCFDVQTNRWQLGGFGLLLAALVEFGLAKDNTVKGVSSSSGMSWRTLAFLAFLITGFQQSMHNLPPYFESAREVSSILKTLVNSFGGLCATTVWSLCAREPSPFLFSKAVLRNRWFWGYAIALQAFGLVSAYLLQYRGMDILAANGLGSMSYPVLIGSCIVAFTVSSVVFLKERLHWRQLVAVILCVAGLILLCKK